MERYVKMSFISIFYLFFWFSNMVLSDAWFYPYRSVKHIKWWRHKLCHRIFNADLLYSCAHFL